MSSHPVRQGMARDVHARSATHDTSRASFHVKHIGQFAKRLEDVRLTPVLFLCRLARDSLTVTQVGGAGVSKSRPGIAALQKRPGTACALGF